MKFKIKHNPQLSHPYLILQDSDNLKRELRVIDEQLVEETLAWARERGLNVLVARGWRGDPFAFAFESEAEAEYFMLGRNQYSE